jgi:hypothetical protein
MQECENVRTSNLHPVVQIHRSVHNKHSRDGTQACSPVKLDKRGVEEIEPENGQNKMIKVQQHLVNGMGNPWGSVGICYYIHCKVNLMIEVLT